MPKPRVIDSGFFDDLAIAKLTFQERLMMIAMVVACADDYGRLVADPAYLRKQTFGYDEGISVEEAATMRVNILAHCPNVFLYKANGQEYIYLKNWPKYQKIRYKIESKLPVPPLEDAPRSDAELAEISHQSRGDSTSDSARVEQSSIEQGSEEKGGAAEGSAEDAPAADFGTVFRLVESTLPKLEPKQIEILQDYWQDDFSALTVDQWQDACRDCAEHNGRNLKYLYKCLVTRRDGGTGPPSTKWASEYGHLVER